MRNFLVIAIVCIASQSHAGMEQSFVCRHCGLKGTFVQGALLTADQFVAFCPKDYFVHISWDYHKRAPKPLGFDRGAPVYSCPVCKKPIARRWDEKECPRCAAKTSEFGRPEWPWIDDTSNQALERTADHRENSFSITSTLNTDEERALVSGRSACSR